MQSPALAVATGLGLCAEMSAPDQRRVAWPRVAQIVAMKRAHSCAVPGLAEPVRARLRETA
jgi:hypothetical protein